MHIIQSNQNPSVARCLLVRPVKFDMACKGSERGCDSPLIVNQSVAGPHHANVSLSQEQNKGI